jgi:hypothetical protein
MPTLMNSRGEMVDLQPVRLLVVLRAFLLQPLTPEPVARLHRMFKHKVGTAYRSAEQSFMGL